MPVIDVKIWEGYEAEKKKRIIKGVTKIFEEMGVPAMAVTVTIHEIPKTNWGTGGELASEKYK